jgi:hypothetical protein
MKCHNCGDDFSSGGLSRHWNFGSVCDYPELTEHQRDVFKGILMSDGYVDNTHSYPRITIDMVSTNYLNFLYEKMKPIFSEPREVSKGSGSVQKIYRLRTRAMPCFDEFDSWYDSGEKVWPNFTINTTVFKHWYCGDGTLDTRRGRPAASISMSNESENIDKVREMFEGSEVPTPSFIQDGEVAYFDVDKTEKLMAELGDAPPDFDYKWVN